MVIDIETTGLEPWNNDIILVTCLEDKKVTIYEERDKKLEKNLADPAIIKVFHNAVFDVGFLEWNEFKVINVECTWLMAKILKEPSCKLKDLAKKYLDIDMDKRLQHGENWTGALTQKHYEYAAMDVKITAKLYYVLKKQLEEKRLMEVYIRENKANAIISKLNNHGIKFDFNGWNEILDNDRKQILKLEKQIKQCLQNEDININSPIQLKKELIDLGIDLKDTSDGQLALYEEKNPVIHLIRKYRKKGVKTRTYGQKLKEKICKDGRIRGKWTIIRAASGRMACTNPPLQGMPAESKQFFVAEKNNKFIIADYSQIELRVLGEISNDQRLKEFFEQGIDLHKGTAALIFNKKVEEITKEERQVAKSLNFGMVYGITEYGIKRNLIKSGLAVSLKQARTFRVQFLEAYEGVQQLQDHLLKALAVRSLGGREWDCKKLTLTQRLNYPIQGTAADGFKEALIRVNKELKESWKICAVVHDEIVLEVPEYDVQEAKEILEQCMINGMKKFIKRIPIVVDIKVEGFWTK